MGINATREKYLLGQIAEDDCAYKRWDTAASETTIMDVKGHHRHGGRKGHQTNRNAVV